VELKLVVNIFTYEQVVEHLEDYWYWNPQEILCFETKYFEMAKSESRLPDNPREYYKEDVSLFAYSTLFGEGHFTYQEAVEYCTDKYSELPGDKKPSNLNTFYQELTDSELRLPSSPNNFYKGKDWVSFRAMFSLEDIVLFTYNEAVEYCREKYGELPDDKKPSKLMTFYQELRYSEPRLPSTPNNFYKGKDWVSFRGMFGLEDIVLFTYNETVEYCSEKYNELPDDKRLSNLNTFYQELRGSEPRLPRNPNKQFDNKGWVSFRVMFGLEDIVFFTYDEAVEYCSKKYNELPGNENPSSLNAFYQGLRYSEPRLPASPYECYKDKSWISIKVMFGLEDIVFFTYDETVEYCSEKYNELSDDENPSKLMAFYQDLRDSEPRLPSTPGQYFQDNGWVSIRMLFDLAA